MQHVDDNLAVYRISPGCSNALTVGRKGWRLGRPEAGGKRRDEILTMLQELPFDIPSLHAAYARGLAPTQLIGECHRRIEAAADPGIFLQLVDRETAVAEAAALAAFDPVSKPLWGVPFAIKDNIDLAGMSTTAACPSYAYTAGRDAFVVAALRRAGAIPIGKTNLDQFATGLVGLRSPYTPPRNALDNAIVPGGSSSGSAVAVARGLVSFALGTDTAGSGRVPAALNGIVGLKPSLGALSCNGVVPACRSLDTVSVFALTVDDAYAVFRAAAQFDHEDAFARRVPAPPLGTSAPNLRVGVVHEAMREFFGDQAQADSYAASIEHIAALGGEVVELDFTLLFQVAAMLYQGAWIAERYTVVDGLLREQPEAILPVLRRLFSAAETLSAADAFRDFHRLRELKRQAGPMLDSVDLLCVPSVPFFCTVDEVAADPVGVNSRLGIYTNFVNLMDMCGIAVPVTLRADGRPGGVTLLARRNHDAQVAAFARVLQRACAAPLGATRWPLPDMPPLVPQAGVDEIALAVVGAHMSGLPLNGELTRLGGRFLRRARTADCYKLYCLPGGPPARPGLVRQGDGVPIHLEVWALPLARLGEFIRDVPPPLCIGTLLLEDGQQVKGFLCEAKAADGARDVTAYGGWRAYLKSLPSTQQPIQEPNHE